MLLYPLQAGPTFVGMHRLVLPKKQQAGNFLVGGRAEDDPGAAGCGGVWGVRA